METWVAALHDTGAEAAWDALMTRYRRLVFGAIRHYTHDDDDVMDVFARVCEVLREDDLRRLRQWAGEAEHRARFSTWLVTVVRNITIDWFRSQHGRHRVSSMAAALPELQRRIFDLVFADRRSHREAYEQLRSADMPDLSFRHTYRAVQNGRRSGLLRELGAAPEWQSDAEPPDDVFQTAERRAALNESLSQLAPDDRVTVELFVVEGVPAADVARIVGLTNAKAVYNRTYRALAQLRERLAARGIRAEDL